MPSIDEKKSQNKYIETKQNLLPLIEAANSKVSTRRWCKSEFVSDVFPFRAYEDVDKYNNAKVELTDTAPGRIKGWSECGFDVEGELVLIRTHMGKGEAQTSIVLERSDACVSSLYFYDAGNPDNTVDYFKFHEQYYSNARPSAGLIFESEKSYTICEYQYDKKGRLTKVEERIERIRLTMPVEQQLARIEAKFEISLPPLFRELYLSKLNECGQSQKEWRQTFIQRAFSNPPALMCAVEVEWMTAEEIVDWEPADYWNPEHKFVPFAGNGAGDLWCFYLNWASDSGIPVVLAYHDEDYTEAYAGDFETFLVRHLLESFSRFWDTMMKNIGCDSIASYKEHLNANLETIAPLLPSWVPRLRKFLDAEPFSIGGDEYSLVQPDAKEELLRELSFEQDGESFGHMR